MATICSTVIGFDERSRPLLLLCDFDMLSSFQGLAIKMEVDKNCVALMARDEKPLHAGKMGVKVVAQII